MIRRLLMVVSVSSIVAACAATDDTAANDDDGTTATQAATNGAGGGSTASTAVGVGGSSTTNGAGGATPPGCYDYNAFTPAVSSFSQDVYPIFQANCNANGCHGGSPQTASAGLWLGATTAPTPADLAAVHGGLVNTPAVYNAPTMSLVVPGDPLRSFLLAKLEYPDSGVACSAVTCNNDYCGLYPPVPVNEALLSTLRSWIMNGAAND